MTPEAFSAKNWVGHLGDALPGLAKAQEPYISRYRGFRVFLPAIQSWGDSLSPDANVEELAELYHRARHSHLWGEAAHCTALNAALDPVCHILLRHPTLARVVGPIIGRDNFYMQILDSGISTTLVDLAAGLMVRAAEHSGDGYRKAASELHALLVPPEKEDATGLPNGLDVGCDAVLFCGPAMKERIDITADMTLLPFEEVLSFVDQELIHEVAPLGAGFHSFQSVGAAVRTYRWRPVFQRAGYEQGPGSHHPSQFVRRARMFLQLLSVASAVPVLPLAELSHRINQSAGRLLGMERQSLGFYRSWSAKDFDGFEKCPVLRPEALAEAKDTFGNRASEGYRRMAPVVGRLAEALARSGPFAAADRVLDVGIALERMFVSDKGRISKKLRNRASKLIATDGPSQETIKQMVQEFYSVRSDIVHNRLHGLNPGRVDAAFRSGFNIARKSLFKLLREGTPEDWNALGDK